jgi:hypothetical protein
MVKIEINYQQILKAVKNLPLKERARLAREIQKDTIHEQWRQIRSEIMSTPKAKISRDEIKRIIDGAREEIYAQNRSRR